MGGIEVGVEGSGRSGVSGPYFLASRGLLLKIGLPYRLCSGVSLVLPDSLDLLGSVKLAERMGFEPMVRYLIR